MAQSVVQVWTSVLIVGSPLCEGILNAFRVSNQLIIFSKCQVKVRFLYQCVAAKSEIVAAIDDNFYCVRMNSNEAVVYQWNDTVTYSSNVSPSLTLNSSRWYVQQSVLADQCQTYNEVGSTVTRLLQSTGFRC